MTSISLSPFSPRTLAVLAISISLALGVSACRKGGDGTEKGAATKQSAGKRGGKGGMKKDEAAMVEVTRAGRRNVAASYTGTAALEARGESTVVARTSGVALQVLAEEGQFVRAGQPLVRLDADRSRLQAAQASAQVRKLEADFRRAQQLAAQRMVSAADVDRLRFDLENARASQRMANLEVSYATITAPISGVVAARAIKPGNMVQPNSTVFRIVDTAQLEATLNVPEREIEALKAGLPVSMTVDALPGQTFNGRIDRVSPVVDAGSGTFRVITAFAGGGLLQPGMFGRIRIDHDQRDNVLVIPRNALLEDDSQPAVFVVRGGKAVRTPLTLGTVDGPWVEVRTGLQGNEDVVTAGKATLRDGVAVQVIAGDAPPAAKPAAAPAQAGKAAQ